MNKTQAIEELEKLEQESKREKHPSVPAHARVRPKHTTATANGLTKAIITWLTLNGYKAWRQSSEGRWRKGKQYKDVLGRVKQLPGQFIPGTNKGFSDVCAIVNGRFIAFEIKIGKDRQSTSQKRFQEEVERSGGMYFLIRSFDEFMRHYQELINK